VKALLIYPEFSGCSLNCEFSDSALFHEEEKVSLLLHAKHERIKNMLLVSSIVPVVEKANGRKISDVKGR